MMLKVRLIGRMRDIKWYRKMMDRNKNLEVLEHSEMFPLYGSNHLYRAYSKVRKLTNSSGD